MMSGKVTAGKMIYGQMRSQQQLVGGSTGPGYSYNCIVIVEKKSTGLKNLAFGGE